MKSVRELSMMGVSFLVRTALTLAILFVGAALIVGRATDTTASTLAGASGSADVVEARQFVLKGPNGRPLAVLGLGADSETPEFVLYDDKGEERIVLAVRPDGTAQIGLNGNSPNRISLMSNPEGPVAICLRDDLQRQILDLHPGGPISKTFESVTALRRHRHEY